METKQYVIVDLEMCRVLRDQRTEDYPLHNEIIEIGAVLVNENLEIADSFKTYVAPQYGGLDDYIRKLTGISDADLEGAPALPEALEAFMAWVPQGAVFVSWSESDEYQLGEEAYYKNAD
ncbi:MAG: exonuclease domain-containing protein, partial [Oscillospiraceae bacterium]|nr:exonuclease domain-containing protein [Oscillospiraceae bacterium]